MEPSSIDFPQHVLAELESLFEKDRIDVQVRLEKGALLAGEIDPAVMLIDNKTGEEIVEERFPTQIQNKAAALLTLLKGNAIV